MSSSLKGTDFTNRSVELSESLKSQLICRKEGHRNKPLEYLCLQKDSKKRMYCLFCLLNDYNQNFAEICLLEDFISNFNNQKSVHGKFQIQQIKTAIEEFRTQNESRDQKQAANREQLQTLVKEINSNVENWVNELKEQIVKQVVKKYSYLKKSIKDLKESLQNIQKIFKEVENEQQKYLEIIDFMNTNEQMKIVQDYSDIESIYRMKLCKNLKGLVDQIIDKKHELGNKNFKEELEVFAFHRMRTYIPLSNHNANKMKLVKSIGTSHKKWIYSIVFLENYSKFVTASDDALICVYETTSCKLLLTMTGHSDRIWVMVRLGNNQLVTGSSDRTIRIWNYQTGKNEKVLYGHTGFVCALLELPDNKFISGSHDHTIRFWNPSDCSQPYKKIHHQKQDRIMTMILINGRHLAVGSETKIHIYDINRSELVKVLAGHDGLLRDLLLCSDYNTLISSSDDKSVRIWNYEKGVSWNVLNGHTHSANRTIVFNKQLIVSVSDDSTIRLWDFEKASEFRTLSGHQGWVIFSTIMNNGMLVTVGSDRQVRFWSDDDTIPLVEQ